MTDIPKELLWRYADAERVAAEVRAQAADAIVAWDTETTGLLPYNGDYVTGLSLAYETHMPLQSWYVPIAHPGGPQAEPGVVETIVAAINETAAWHAMHHAQFDWAMMRNLGLEARQRTIDVQQVHWLTDENAKKALKILGDRYVEYGSSKESKELKALRDGPKVMDSYRLIRAALPEVPAKEAKQMARSMSQSRGWGQLWSNEMAVYGAKDAELTYRLAYLLTNWDAQHVVSPRAHDREMRLQRKLYDMRGHGILLRKEGLREAATAYEARADEIAAKYPEYALSKTDDVATLLYDDVGLEVLGTTKTGKRSTDKNALEMHEGHPVVEDVLEWRRMTKALTAYARPLLHWAETAEEARIHPEFSNVGTVTGRLSCALPNLMQIPRGDTLPEIKACFRPDPGMELWEFDLAQAELRVAASLSRDVNLTSAIVEGRDLHTETAMLMFGRADGRWRTLAKNINFGILYGAGPKKVAVFLAKIGIPADEALSKAYGVLDVHRRQFPRLHRLSAVLARRADEQGYLPLPADGRFRHFRTPGQRISTHKALNAVVQGSVAEFVKDVMLDDALYGTLVLQIHDALVFSVRPGEHERVEATLREVTDRVNPFRLPMFWEAKQWAA